ncbi:MAG TPA: hypothetical protein VM785_06220, partial [Gaiellales bacterium]|nr:hypothetical protein [Gaiellales bacterium]
MIHSVPDTDRIATPWPSTDRWLDRLMQTATAVMRWALRRCGFGSMPELRMSREWLAEYEH